MTELKNYTHKETCEEGRSMIEMLGVLAIIGVLSVGGIAGYSMAMAKVKQNQALDELQQLVTNTRTAFASQTDYTGLDNAVLTSMGILAKSTNVFGGGIIVAPADADATQFVVNYNGLSKDTCIKLATSDWGGATGGLTGISTDGSAGTTGKLAGKVASDWTKTDDTKLPIKLTVASAGCSNAGTTNSVSIRFR